MKDTFEKKVEDLNTKGPNESIDGKLNESKLLDSILKQSTLRE